ncbi:recombinase family protein [Lolliginicoccus suaedae]|uniref:recombinase family protein n=1 Tax=Lolliginicoccus suaedae TaxID=2605429 RepID=UPI0011EC3E8D|nr:recombinase family protein [Lolliginicoccus suaedae]
MSDTTTARRYGYARVSTSRQTLAQQIDALRAAGVDEEHIYRDVISGTKTDRPGLAELRRHLRPGDTLVIVALDRLGRTLSGILRTLEELTEQGVSLVSLREGFDMTTPAGRAAAGMFAVMAQLERDLIVERSQAARDALKARGGSVGRKRALTEDQARQARALKDRGETARAICETLGISRATLYRYLAESTPATT